MDVEKRRPMVDRRLVQIINHPRGVAPNVMKQSQWSLLTLLLLFTVLTAHAASKKVVVKQPGTLLQSLSANHLKRISRLTVEGTLNANDFEAIRLMASTKAKDGKPGTLRSLDLSKARLQVDYRNLPDSLLAHCDVLTDLTLPDSLFSIGYNSFEGCTSLKRITFHNVFYVSYTLFRDLPSLELVMFKGRVWHIDGTPFLNLPKLQRVTFGSTVVRTGGPLLAKNCPRLSQVSFKGMILDTHFQQVEECPQLSQIAVEGYVGYQRGNLFVGRSLPEGGVAMADSVARVFERDRQQSKEVVDGFGFAGVAYNLACLYSLKSDTASALRFLDLSYALGPMSQGYAHIMRDPDLDNVRHTARFAQYVERVRQLTDYLYILRQAPAYETGKEASGKRFTYAPASDERLMRIRHYFNLDSIAGKGDEVSQLKNVMNWLHDQIRHDGSSGIPNVKRSAIELYDACKQQNRGLNCRGMAIVLSELYMALGHPARFMTCQSKAYNTDPDCHVICEVWSQQLGKWLWMDPSFAAFVSDGQGHLLSIAEVRERLRTDKPLVLNEDANWNHEVKQTKEDYLDNYMAKNLYYLSCYLESGANTEDGTHTYVTIQPKGQSFPVGGVVTHDDAWFWQAPNAQ